MAMIGSNTAPAPKQGEQVQVKPAHSSILPSPGIDEGTLVFFLLLLLLLLLSFL